jgi:hypothetical protein
MNDLAGALLPRDRTSLRVSAIGRGGPDRDRFLTGLDADLAAIASLHERLDGRVRVEVLEVRIPEVLLFAGTRRSSPLPEAAAREAGRFPGSALEAVPGSPLVASAAIRSFLDSVAEAIERAGLGDLRVYYEGGFRENWREGLGGVIEAIAGHRFRNAGVKLRCGGASASAIPSLEQVAFVLDACRRSDVSFKATAGLHHPVRSHRAETGGEMHGFLNVFGAALLSREHGLGEERIRPILAEDDPGAFSFTPEAFCWRDLRIPADRIRELRRHAVTSFGSCSFDEPREDLRSLGILEPARGSSL